MRHCVQDERLLYSISTRKAALSERSALRMQYSTLPYQPQYQPPPAEALRTVTFTPYRLGESKQRPVSVAILPAGVSAMRPGPLKALVWLSERYPHGAALSFSSERQIYDWLGISAGNVLEQYLAPYREFGIIYQTSDPETGIALILFYPSRYLEAQDRSAPDRLGPDRSGADRSGADQTFVRPISDSASECEVEHGFRRSGADQTFVRSGADQLPISGVVVRQTGVPHLKLVSPPSLYMEEESHEEGEEESRSPTELSATQKRLLRYLLEHYPPPALTESLILQVVHSQPDGTPDQFEEEVKVAAKRGNVGNAVAYVAGVWKNGRHLTVPSLSAAAHPATPAAAMRADLVDPATLTDPVYGQEPVKMYMTRFSLIPSVRQAEEMARVVKDLQRWSAVLDLWELNSQWRRENVANLLSRYSSGKDLPVEIPTISDAAIMTYPGLKMTERNRWLTRFNDAAPDQRAEVIRQFLEEHPLPPSRPANE